MKIRKLAILSILSFTLAGCNFGSPANTDPVNPDPVNPDPVNPDPIPPTPPGPTPVETFFTPKVGEFRKLFSYAEDDSYRFYNYCPTSFVEGNTRHTYFCTNKISGNITDYVGYRTATLVNGVPTYSDVSYPIQPGEVGSWDSRHTCDPSVVKGKFKFKGEEYPYLMAYLGCLTSDCTYNETGIAVAKSPAGPWIKCETNLIGTKINPIIAGSDEKFSINSNNWGTGQPSLVSYDGEGKVLFFTTIGASNGTFTNLRLFDFSNIDNYQLLNERLSISTKGVRTAVQGQGNIINNADFAYDPLNKRILMVKDRQPINTDGRMPTVVGPVSDVYYIDDSQGNNPGDVLFAGNNTTKQWKFIGSISEENSGQFRNHNCGLLTDPYGQVLESDRIGVMYTKSDEGSQPWPSLATYRLYETAFAFPDDYFLKN